MSDGLCPLATLYSQSPSGLMLCHIKEASVPDFKFIMELQAICAPFFSRIAA
jgi:hypothetical protein